MMRIAFLRRWPGSKLQRRDLPIWPRSVWQLMRQAPWRRRGGRARSSRVCILSRRRRIHPCFTLSLITTTGCTLLCTATRSQTPSTQSCRDDYHSSLHTVCASYPTILSSCLRPHPRSLDARISRKTTLLDRGPSSVERLPRRPHPRMRHCLRSHMHRHSMSGHGACNLLRTRSAACDQDTSVRY